MRCLLRACCFIVLIACDSVLMGQAPLPDQPLCFRGQVSAAQVALPGGFSLQISGRDQAQDCEVVLQTPSGENAHHFSDAIISLSGATGEDVTGDGPPDLVLESTSGGSGHFVTVLIYSLEAAPRPLFASDVFGGHQGELPDVPRDRLIGNGSGLRFVRNGHNGRIALVATDDYDLFDNLPRGEWIGVAVPFELVKGAAVDVTPDVADFEGEIAQARSKIEPQALRNFMASDPERDDDLKRDEKYWDTKRAILQIVFDYIYSGRPEMAWSTLNELWPAPDRSRIRQLIADGYCEGSGIRKRLGLPLGPACDSPR